MVPADRVAGRPLPRLPRASGDGPRHQAGRADVVASPPRERGWSQPLNISRHAAAVSPARAGMVPPGRRGGSPRRSLPRASGGGPFEASVEVKRDESPPRERGWFTPRGPTSRSTRVSPARAGMVPRQIRRPPQSPGLPRASGDGPLVDCCDQAITLSPPRERGWPLAHESNGPLHAVSPARAGMGSVGAL